MGRLAIILGSAAALAGGTALLASLSYRSAMAEAEAAWRDLAARRYGPAETYDPAMVSELPEVGRRYFAHAITPGTPLSTTVELTMRGTFLLGDVKSHQSYGMTARQILTPPDGFVWIAKMRSGAMRISGSDALAGGGAWTRFWLMGLIPVAQQRSSPDMIRSARFRAGMEAVWAPASLLPQNGVRWEQIGPDRARVTFPGPEPRMAFELGLGPQGEVRELVGQRWSNANAAKSFRLQPFGGTVEREARFGGYTVPSRVRIGNHYGTPDYLPFYQSEIVGAHYLASRRAG